MIDIHSHILYGCDDGAKTIEESLELLKAEKRQGVDLVYFTPHFHTEKNNLEEYSLLIKEHYNNLLLKTNTPEYPKIKTGFEVHYFSGMKNCDCLDKLALSGTNLILTELDFFNITEDVIEEICEFSWYTGYIPVLAHIERYHKFPGFKKLLKEIKKNKVYCQITAASFLNKNIFKKEAFKLLKEGYVNFIASDTHSLEKRPPKIKEAFEEISKKCGKDIINNILEFEKSINF